MRFRSLLLLVPAAVIAGLVVAACGGSDATATPVSATSTPPRPTATPVPTQAPAPTATLAPGVTAAPTATAVPGATATRPPSATPTAAPAVVTPTPVPPTPTSSGVQPKTGGVLRMRYSGTYAEDWNDYAESGQFSVVITQNVLNNLTYLDPADGITLRPDLAQSWTVSSDGKTITWNLRRDAKWHDGAAFISKDVMNSLTLAKTPTDVRSALHTVRLKIVQSFEAPDANTFRANLSQPSASFMTNMSIPSMLIYPSQVAGVPGTWQTNPVGTGPFKFKDLKKGIGAQFVKNEAYFKKDAAGRALPYLDGVTFSYIVDKALTLAAFRAGNLDCACSYTTDITVADKDAMVKAVPKMKIGTTPGVMAYLDFNSRPPYDNLKVRQAVHFGIDRKQLIDAYRLGQGIYPPTYLTPSTFGGKLSLPDSEILALPGFRVKDGKKDPADVALSKQLFKDAGIDPANLKLNFTTSIGAFDDLNEIVVTLFGALGVKVDFKAVLTPELALIRTQGNFDITMDPANNAYEDPSDLLLPNNVTGAARNWGKWSFPKIDQLANDQERELDPAKRAALIKDLQREILAQAFYVPLNHIASIYASQGYVEGFVLNRAYNVSSAHKFDEVWLNR